MPSYNQAHYITQAVRSVLAQDDPDWELWILDNSTDRTPEAMRAFADPRIRFHHVPQRMDPGSCLNWMLEHSRGEAFAYVHTDNNLRPDFVTRMRAALAGKSRALAYCDQRFINEQGSVTNLSLRGPFDLARLFSLDTLGVPFAATRALAQAVGGFRPKDLADDVRFCVSAYGLADYVYVRQPLVDYRIHGGSRYNAEGAQRMRQTFLDLFLELRPQVLARGQEDPVAALARATIERFENLEWFIEDLWHRKLSVVLDPWWRDGLVIEHLFHAGLVRMPGFSRGWARPPLRPLIRDSDGRIAAWPWSVYAAASYHVLRRRDVEHFADRIQATLLPWAYLTLGGHAERIRVADTGFRSLLAARLLEYSLGWRPGVGSAATFPGWLDWPRAGGGEPALSFAGKPQLVTG